MALDNVPAMKPQAMEKGFMHPCEFIERHTFEQQEALRMHRIRSTHGIGAAIETGLTEVTLRSSRRLGALPSSSTLYNSYRNKLTQITPQDVYGLAENDPNMQPSSRAEAEREVFGYELTMKNFGM